MAAALMDEYLAEGSSGIVAAGLIGRTRTAEASPKEGETPTTAS